MSITSTDLLKQLEWRYAVKKFDASKKIPEETWAALERALILTPSSYGLQPYKFLLVQNAAIRKELTPFSWKQTQVSDCSHFVVFAGVKTVTQQTLDHYLDAICKTRQVTRDSMKDYEKGMQSDLISGPRSKMIPEWSARQAYIALGNLMTSAAALHVDACPLEGISPPDYDRILGLTNTNYQTLCALALGYRHSEDWLSKLKKVRFDSSELIQRID